MAAVTTPALRLQRDLKRRPYGGAWWPKGRGLSQEVLDLVGRWPVELASIVGYAYLPDNWDRTDVDTPAEHRGRTLVLSLGDRTNCRLLVVPPEAAPAVAERLLAEASDPDSTWTAPRFEEALVEGTPHDHRVRADRADV